ncbi:hypothetical protein ACYOEI_11670 [Singulisphaera rosea]
MITENQATPSPAHHRRLTLLDLMIVVAGVAVSLWVLPEGVIPTAVTAFSIITGKYGYYAKAQWLSILFVRFTYPVTFIWTLTTVALALTPPCPPARRLARQPGFVACGVVVMTVLIAGPLNYAISSHNFIPGLSISTRFQVELGEALTFRRGEGGFAVAAAWLVLWANGRWRAQPSLADRLGRLVGLFWIVTIPCGWTLAGTF